MAHPRKPVDNRVTCGFCGAYAVGDLPLTWSTAVEGGRSIAFCDQCSRDHVRSMEAKLDSAWW
jgi:hypothetical protein